MHYSNTSKNKLIIYSSTLEALILNQPTFLVNSTQEDNNIHTLPEEKLTTLNLDPKNLPYSMDNNIIFWQTKIGLTQKNIKQYIITDTELKNSLINQNNPPQTIQQLPSLEELQQLDQISIIFEKYPHKTYTNLYKIKLKSNIPLTFIDSIIDPNFIATCINNDNTMYIYLTENPLNPNPNNLQNNLQNQTTQENQINEIINYYQQIYTVNTTILTIQTEQIISFRNIELIPQTEKILFLGYKNGIYNPFNITDLAFKIQIYNLILSNPQKTINYILNIKEKLTDFNTKNITQQIQKLWKILNF